MDAEYNKIFGGSGDAIPRDDFEVLPNLPLSRLNIWRASLYTVRVCRTRDRPLLAYAPTRILRPSPAPIAGIAFRRRSGGADRLALPAAVRAFAAPGPCRVADVPPRPAWPHWPGTALTSLTTGAHFHDALGGSSCSGPSRRPQPAIRVSLGEPLRSGCASAALLTCGPRPAARMGRPGPASETRVQLDSGVGPSGGPSGHRCESVPIPAALRHGHGRRPVLGW